MAGKGVDTRMVIPAEAGIQCLATRRHWAEPVTGFLLEAPSWGPQE